IDRPIRPVFPDGFIDEVQIQCWVMSHDQENDSDVLAGTAASAALAISNAPFEGPIATVRVGRIHTDEGPQFVINPTVSQMEFSDMDLVLSGHADGINMIEVGAAEAPDGQVLAGMRFGYEHIKDILGLISELTEKAGVEKVMGDLLVVPDDIAQFVKEKCYQALVEIRQIKGKADRNAKVDALRETLLNEHFPERTAGNVAQWPEAVQP